MTQIIGLTEREVYWHFGHTYAARGDSYERSSRVLQVELDLQSKTVSGEVQGSQPKPYQVRVVLTKNLMGITQAQCSCPMGGSCKHSAALALHAIRTGEIPIGYASDPPVKEQLPAVVDSAEMSPQLRTWVSGLASALSVEADEPKAVSTAGDSVLYILDSPSDRLILKFAHGRKLKDGSWGKIHQTDLERLATRANTYVVPEDLEIIRLFLARSGNDHHLYRGGFPEIPEICQLILDRLISTGRCYWRDLDTPPLVPGPAKQAVLRWEALADGSQMLKFDSGLPDDKTVVAGVPWYVNPVESTFGPLVLPVPISAVKRIIEAPRIEPQEAVSASFALMNLGSIIPKPATEYVTETVLITPTPTLKLISQDQTTYSLATYRYGEKLPVALLSFDYPGKQFDRSGGSERRIIDGKKISVERKDTTAEKGFIKQLEDMGLFNLRNTPSAQCYTTLKFPDGHEVDWLKFAAEGLPALKHKGWQIEVDKSYKYDVVAAEEEWVADATEGSDFWFSLNLGITIEGQTVPLLPIIHQAIKRMAWRDPLTELDHMNKGGTFYAPLKDGRYVALPFERVKAVVQTLIELFDKESYGAADSAEVSLPQIMGLAQAVAPKSGDSSGWLIGTKLRSLIERIRQFEGLTPVAPPATFRAELRPYQLEGLSWLNFLREFELGGILADDMGLGKTVQALAHIACEKKAHRLNNPYLVVCPTSVLPNWLSEIEKFAPSFKVTALTGPARTGNFKKIAGSDIVVTTYPLVSRDVDTLVEYQWQAVILDEAQFIKNPATQVAQAVRRLRSSYRVCLTGTPIENHLGELWSQFNFLMPGFLRDLPTFTRAFRTPIEKQKNAIVQKQLATKVRPFLLRRTKELVAKELPEKTVIIKKIELEGAQRDLYETVRLAMYEKVQEALASKGLAKSQIIILDALLKLRQVCCDPRLVSLPTAKKVESTAKLQMLLEMIDELLAEGKRILLFSQFTSMLDLIIPELAKRKIDFAEIRGTTKDRFTPVKLFQSGQVPLFLLSLKAGGTGLNLTAADTVIHYDPWWNPAVENQATDRAHRIGQNKAVFVFKLIATGTIEDRMLELQEKKRAIAEGIYGDDNAMTSKLTAEDLESLFSPLGAARVAAVRA